MFPLEANINAVLIGISFEIAVIKATSEEKGRTVAAKNAATNKAISEMRYSLL